MISTRDIIIIYFGDGGDGNDDSGDGGNGECVDVIDVGDVDGDVVLLNRIFRFVNSASSSSSSSLIVARPISSTLLVGCDDVRRCAGEIRRNAVLKMFSWSFSVRVGEFREDRDGDDWGDTCEWGDDNGEGARRGLITTFRIGPGLLSPIFTGIVSVGLVTKSLGLLVFGEILGDIRPGLFRGVLFFELRGERSPWAIDWSFPKFSFAISGCRVDLFPVIQSDSRILGIVMRLSA